MRTIWWNHTSLRPAKYAIGLLLAVAFMPSGFAATSDYAVMVSASIQKSPPQITLNWPGDGGATGYTVSRKSPGSGSWGGGTNVSASANSYTDTGVSVGQLYEYQIVKSGSGYTGYGYITSGIEVPLTDGRGKVILVVDNTYAGNLSSELARLQ